jgi:hypothetical protein
MTAEPVSHREIEAFRRFVTMLPHGQDPVLVVLKGHLLIEEQLRQIVDEHVKRPKALMKAQFSCSHVICLAEAFCDDRAASWLWESLRNLNSLRNDIAHKIEPKKFQERLARIVSSVGENSVFAGGGFGDMDEQAQFEMCLWVLFTNVAALVQRPAASVLRLVTDAPHAL